MKVFPYNIQNEGYQIPCGKYINTVFNDYTVYISSTGASKIANARLSDNAILIGTNKDNFNSLPITVNPKNNILELNKSRIQIADIKSSTLIKLPSVSKYTEISLIFSTSKYVNIMIPSCKMNSTSSYVANKTFRLNFTFINNSIGWIGEAIVYG